MQPMSPLVLIVEDEIPQAEMLRYNLESDGFRVLVAGNGEEGLLLTEEQGPDLIVLDWMMPELPGIELCRKLRATKSGREIPIIMLTARGEERDRIKGLDIGADDYVVKPYSPKELISRIRAILRRAHPAAAGETLEFDDISVDTVTHKVTRAGHLVHLGPTEYKLLCTFLERPGRVYSRAQLLDLVWGRDIYVEERTVDVHIRRLRKALNPDGVPNLIRTIRGAGYSIDRVE